MVGRLIRNFLNGQHFICKVQHQPFQTVHVAFLQQCAKNVCPAAVLSCGVRTASSNRPSNRFELSGEYSNNGGSTLLDAYHNNRADNLQLADLGKHAVAFALDPQGSRFIEQKLGRARPTEKAQFVDVLRGHVLTLAQQMYGSHVIETALKSVDKASQIELINEISTQVIPLSLHKYGNWVIRSVLEHCTEQQKRTVLEQLHGNLLTLVMDQYGSFVIRHVIEHGWAEDRERIVRCLQDDIMKYAQDKFGSLVIMNCLIYGTTDQKKTLFDKIYVGGPETLQNARQLMADEFGNLVIQKFFEYGTEDQKARLVDALRGHVLTLALQIFGAPVIQTALKSVDKASQMEIIEELKPRACVIRCIKDRYGAYVMDTIFELIEPEQLQFVVDAITTSPSDSVASLCLHEYGNWVIRHVLKHCTEQQKRPVLEQLHENVLTLVTDKYGCFVIQHAIEHGLPEDRERITRNLKGDILENAHHKSICSVIEKCFVFGTTEQRNELIDQVCTDNGSGKPPLLQMMKHPFANDAVLKMHDFADSAHRDKMMFAIEEHIPALIRLQTRRLEQQSRTKSIRGQKEKVK